MLYSMDGNDSIKRVARSIFTADAPSPLTRNELVTHQCIILARYYPQHSYVDIFAVNPSPYRPRVEVCTLYKSAEFTNNTVGRRRQSLFRVIEKHPITSQIPYCRSIAGS